MNRKPLSEEQKAKAIKRTLAWRAANPERVREYTIQYLATNKERRRAYAKAYQQTNREKRARYVKEFYKRKPWYRSWISAKQRCENPHDQGYKYYGARGIRFSLTQRQMELIWKRDKAYQLRRPSIDRINPRGNYTWRNVRIIELWINCKLGALSMQARRREELSHSH